MGCADSAVEGGRPPVARRCTMVPVDVSVGLTLTVLAWLGLVWTVVRGRANVERRVRSPTPTDEDTDE
jgi:hypothetical protein